MAVVTETPDLGKLFNPQRIVIIGVSSREFQFGGLSFLQRLQEVGYSGRLYPVNPKVDAMRGLRCYPDLKSLPEVPDLAIVCIPAGKVPSILEECGQIGLTHIHILTSGFKELGTPDGVQLEESIYSISKRFSLNVVGPNCMGPYSPSSKLTAWGGIPGIDGPLGMISQSGGIAQRFTELACSLGIGISKAVSIGNATVLGVCDYLEYMAQDQDIKVIVLYLENVREGRRFIRILREVNRKKPIVILKGGNSDAGNRTIASHTGSMVGKREIWDSVFKQTGVIGVRSFHEWVDTAIALSLLPDTVVGKGVFLATGGGGNSIIYSDIFSHDLVEKGTIMRKKFCENGIPAYPSPERAARALSHYQRFQSFRDRVTL